MVNKVIGVTFCIVVTLVSFNVNAQVFPNQNGKSLQGVDTFRFHASIQNWMKVGVYSQFEKENNYYRLEVQDIAANMLIKSGIKIDRNSRNYLICSLQILEDEDILQVMYSIRAYYYQYSLFGLHKLQWESGIFGYSDFVSFGVEFIAEACTGQFINEWQRYN